MHDLLKGAKSSRVLSGEEYRLLISRGIVLGQAERAIVADSVVIAENTSTGDTRVLGRANELLTEGGSKRVLHG